MRDVVICLPGITGSALHKDGCDVWNISGGALFSALTTLGGSIRDLDAWAPHISSENVLRCLDILHAIDLVTYFVHLHYSSQTEACLAPFIGFPGITDLVEPRNLMDSPAEPKPFG